MPLRLKLRFIAFLFPLFACDLAGAINCLNCSESGQEIDKACKVCSLTISMEEVISKTLGRPFIYLTEDPQGSLKLSGIASSLNGLSDDDCSFQGEAFTILPREDLIRVLHYVESQYCQVVISKEVVHNALVMTSTQFQEFPELRNLTEQSHRYNMWLIVISWILYQTPAFIDDAGRFIAFSAYNRLSDYNHIALEKMRVLMKDRLERVTTAVVTLQPCDDQPEISIAYVLIRALDINGSPLRWKIGSSLLGVSRLSDSQYFVSYENRQYLISDCREVVALISGFQFNQNISDILVSVGYCTHEISNTLTKLLIMSIPISVLTMVTGIEPADAFHLLIPFVGITGLPRLQE
ncbi:hypothetical protein [Spongorhabdus nitratireducens]